jgi:DNA-binding NtrC family response regulator
MELSRREWPGNVRELRNAVERMVILSQGAQVDLRVLDNVGTSTQSEAADVLSMAGTFQEFKERSEAAFIRKQLELHRWNVSKTAEALNIQRSHLYTKMKRYGLMREEDEEKQ